ncbi:MAG: transketolase C-terminal domain-containing protein, partial [Dehalococcoidales bacterium]|nr:transketolase C-terminal domain-containing protein [Dehalococcoidales bacterium]
EGISAEVVDLRSLVPLDVDAIVKSVKKTGRLVIAHEAMKRGGVAGEIAFRLMEAAPELMKAMKAPIKRVAAKNVALLRSQFVEPSLIPQAKDIVAAVKEIV